MAGGLHDFILKCTCKGDKYKMFKAPLPIQHKIILLTVQNLVWYNFCHFKYWLSDKKKEIWVSRIPKHSAH